MAKRKVRQKGVGLFGMAAIAGAAWLLLRNRGSSVSGISGYMEGHPKFKLTDTDRQKEAPKGFVIYNERLRESKADAAITDVTRGGGYTLLWRNGLREIITRSEKTKLEGKGYKFVFDAYNGDY